MFGGFTMKSKKKDTDEIIEVVEDKDSRWDLNDDGKLDEKASQANRRWQA